MGRRRRKALPTGIIRVRRRIDHWRETRKHRSPMPEHLWEAAVALAEEHGINPVARGLGVSYESIKLRATAVAEKRRVPAGFVELSPASTAAFRPAGGIFVELVHPNGAKLTINLPSESESELDVASLADAFLSHGA